MRGTLASGYLALVTVHAVFGQPADAVPAFEVAEIKLSRLAAGEGGKGQFLPSGRVDLPNVTLKELIMVSYGVQENMVTGGPAWLDTDRFAIVAKAPAGTSIDALRMMFQPLMAERFKLAMHREDRPLAAYALVVGKGGPRLEPSKGSGPADCSWQQGSPGQMKRVCRNISMSELARQMPGWGRARIYLPVVDLTGLKGSYDLQLEWSGTTGGKGDAPRIGDAQAGADLAGSTVFDAMQQVGLKLEPRKLPLPVMVIDHVERLPTAN